MCLEADVPMEIIYIAVIISLIYIFIYLFLLLLFLFMYFYYYFVLISVIFLDCFILGKCIFAGVHIKANSLANINYQSQST